MTRRVRRRRERLRSTLPGVGAMLIVGGAVMGAAAVTGVVYRDWWSVLWFLLGGGLAAGTGLLARRAHRDLRELDDVDAMMTAAIGWLTLALLGAVPFVLAAHLTPGDVVAGYVPTEGGYGGSSLSNFQRPLHALFESMSGWTTTGLTMSVQEPTMPHAFLMYRSMMQWTGGAGIIVLALTVLHQHGGVTGLHLYRAEARRHRLRPSIVETARRVWRVYVVLTAGLFVYLFVAALLILPDVPVTEAAFDAINHAMTGQATGGFSTLDESIGGYGSSAMELLHLLPMISGAIALPVHYVALIRREPLRYLRDVQDRALFGGLAVGAVTLTALLVGVAAVDDPVREGLFQGVTALTGTGWQTSDIGGWPANATLFIVLPMIIGGAAGSTVGGIKLLRAIYLVRGVSWRIQDVFRPSRSIDVFRVGERTLELDEFHRETSHAAMVLVLWLIAMAVSILVMTVVLGDEPSLANVIFESATAQNNVGLSAGITDPAMPAGVEAVFILQMWIGRLEIVPVLVLVRGLLRRAGW